MPHNLLNSFWIYQNYCTYMYYLQQFNPTYVGLQSKVILSHTGQGNMLSLSLGSDATMTNLSTVGQKH